MALTDVRQRVAQASYLDCADKVPGAPSFELLGTGFRELNEEPGAQVRSKRYINQKSTSKGISGYEWQSPFAADQIRSEKAIEFICSIGEFQKTGAEAERDYIIVDLDKKAESEDSETLYKARKIKVAIEVSKFGNEDGEMTCEGNFLGVSDVIAGTFDTATKKWKDTASII